MSAIHERVHFCTRCYEVHLQAASASWSECGLCQAPLQRVPDAELEALINAAFRLGGWDAVEVINHYALLCTPAFQSVTSVKYVGLYS